MPNRPHHSDKWHRCVEKVMDQGNDESSASAICTKSLQDAGEDIYAAEAVRDLHVLGALGSVRSEIVDGREFLIVPIVALVEGVIHAVNSDTPEFVPAKTLRDAAQSWIGKPLCVGHPVRNGRHCSANAPDILASHAFGTIRSATVKGTKLCMEGLVDPLRLKALKQDALLSDIRAGRQVEISVGARVGSSGQAGVWNGKRYVGSWEVAEGDHLAFLPGGRGACSIEMGCGANRAAMHFVAAEGIETIAPAHLPIMAFVTLEDDMALDERMRRVVQAVYDEYYEQPEPVPYVEPLSILDDRVIIRYGDETLSVPYVVKDDGSVSLGKGTPVKQAWVAAAGSTMDCPACNGTGGPKHDCVICDGTGQVVRAAEIKALVGARHSKNDTQLIQSMHDYAMKLGAKCSGDSPAVPLSNLSGQPQERSLAIRHEGGRWVLYGRDGSTRLGSHDSESEAKAQKEAISKLTMASGSVAATGSRCGCGGHK